MGWGKAKVEQQYEIMLPVKAVQLVGESWFAITYLAGVTIRGPRRDGPLSAIQGLLGTFIDGSYSGGSAHDQSVTALELALAGLDIESVHFDFDRPEIGSSDT